MAYYLHVKAPHPAFWAPTPFALEVKLDSSTSVVFTDPCIIANFPHHGLTNVLRVATAIEADNHEPVPT